MMKCTSCGDELPDGAAAIVGFEREGKLVFQWACCHQPAGDCAVLLASATCAQKFVDEHPEYLVDITVLIAEGAHKHNRKD